MTHGLLVHMTTQHHGGTLDPKSAHHPPAGDLRRHGNTVYSCHFHADLHDPRDNIHVIACWCPIRATPGRGSGCLCCLCCEPIRIELIVIRLICDEATQKNRNS
uniref:Uncharacterized protein n=1 Tax=Hordeum vulgare subsp. vulgare TaxID=112509 RepID=A0A8I6XFV7_HORVV